MIRKLQIKLILASMVSLLLVLSVILGIVGVLNYRKIVTDADSILGVLQENHGSFPMDGPVANEPAPTNNPPKDNHRFSPELPYESRYFSVFLTEGGTVISVNTGKNCGSGSTTAIEYAQTVTRIGSSKGFVDDYRYVSYISDNEIHLIFLDYGREMNSFRTFLFTSAGVSAGGLVAVMLLLIFLSGQSSSLFQKAMKSKNNLSPTPETPLTIIDADAEVLEMDIGENERLKDIQMQTKRLAQLTNSLILLSRMEEQPYIEKIEFPVSDLVEERQIPAKPGEPPAFRNL